ncbi:MAG: aminotransferase class I/II-fold pyridoxal phosphate-dependent enzyme, partial [Chloroflexi bacterium]|nr:aminotransferase class I/II-fold pyridoxal phosphate-dependent enzyme [Chloroflexota bacterium]
MKTIHGGLDTVELRELGLRPEQVIDFSSNVNPLGTSEPVRQAAANADLSAYPDRDCLALREALAERLGVGVDHLLVGNGSTELIHLLARSRLRAGSTCLIFEPTFGEYEAAARLTGADVQRVKAREADGFCWPLDETEQVIE